MKGSTYKLFRPIKRMVYLGIILTYISGVFLSSELHILTSLFCLLALILFLPSVRGVTLGLSLTFLGMGLLVLLSQEALLESYIIALRRMANILTMVTLIKALGIPMELGGYSNDIRSFVNREVQREGFLYIIATLIAYMIGVSIVVASVPVVFYTIERAVRSVSEKPEKFLSMSIKRGLFLALLWTPASPLMAVALDSSGASIIEVLPVSAMVSILGLILAMILYRPPYFQSEQDNSEQNNSEGYISNFDNQNDFETSTDSCGVLTLFNSQRTKILVTALVSLIVLLITLEYFLPFNMLDLVIVVAVLFSGIWSLLLGQGKSYAAEAKKLFYDSLPDYGQQVSLFLCAGFFAGAIGESEQLMANILDSLVSFTGVLGFLYLIPVIIILLAITGIHPLITITVLGEGVSALGNAVPLPLLGYTFVLGGALALLISPFSAATLITAELVHRNPFKVGVVWNGLFGGYVLIIGLIVLTLRVGMM